MKYVPIFLLLLAVACSPENRQNESADRVLYRNLWSRLDSTGAGTPEVFAAQKALLDSIYPIMMRTDTGREPLWHASMGALLATQRADSTLFFLDKAEQLAAGRASMDTVRALFEHGRLNYFLSTGEYDKFIQTAPKVYPLVKKHAPARFIRLLEELGNVYLMINDTTNAHRHIIEGLQLARNASERTRFRTYLAYYFSMTAKEDSAELVFEKVLADTVGLPQFQQGLNFTNSAHFKAQKGNTNGAISDLEKGIELLNAAKMPQATTYGNLAGVYQMKGLFDKSLPYYDSAIKVSAFQHSYAEAAEYNTIAAQALERLGRYQDAYRYSQASFSYTRLADSMQLRAKLHGVETQLGIQLKDEQLKNMELAGQAAEATNQKRAFAIIGLLIILVLLAALAFLVFRRQRLSRQVTEMQLEQRLLRLQMEPHFIFNVLAQAMSFMHNGVIDKAQTYLGKFAKLLRLILVNTRRPLVPLQDEVEALDSYLFIQQVNMDDAFSAKLEVYEGYDEEGLLIPPMIIQPFVENAIQHGVSSMAGKGRITVRIQREPHTIRCIIEDNGPGLARTNASQEKPSLATQITRERLSLLSKQTGQQASLVISEKAPSETGVVVELTIPFQYIGAQ